MSRVVVDASVVVKWFTQEDQRGEALSLRQSHMDGGLTLTAPALLAYEVANALRYNPSLTTEDQERAAMALFLMGIVLEPPTQGGMVKAVELADRYDITIYDAAYLSLAVQRDVTLVTADVRLAEKAAEMGRITDLASFADG